MNIKYERIGDYELPNLSLKDKKEGIINRYGYLRLAYLKKENNSLYTTLVMKDELTNWIYVKFLDTFLWTYLNLFQFPFDKQKYFY